MAEAATAATAATAAEAVTAIEMVMVTAMTPTLTPSALPSNAQQVVQKIPRHELGRCSSLTSQNGGSINQGMNRLPYNLADQRSHIEQMATIVTILIGVISLLGKRNKLTREVFWWLVAGREHLMIFFTPKKPEMCAGRWCGQQLIILKKFWEYHLKKKCQHWCQEQDRCSAVLRPFCGNSPEHIFVCRTDSIRRTD
jgi:hypothetical protein